MTDGLPDLRPDDRALLASAGLSLERVDRQIALLQAPPPPVRLERACTLGDGITALTANDDVRLLPLWEAAAAAGRLSKFVPASGAASRMFDAATKVRGSRRLSRRQLTDRRAAGDADAAAVLTILDRLDDLPFVDALAVVLGRDASDLTKTSTHEEVAALLAALLDEDGLAFSTLAKGLIPFHRYGKEVRTAFEEHLIEGALYVADAGGRARYHFTVPASQQGRFEDATARLAERLALDLEVAFSIQSPATDTVAIDARGGLVRDTDGRLLLRPGGHGALLGNLEQTGGDVVFLKNIDNVVPADRHDEVALWMKRLAGLLLELEQQSHALQQRLEEGASPTVLRDAESFCRERLAWKPTTAARDLRGEMLDRLDRPLRVCGMVRNEGEPGGGPFWVRDASGGISRQIVEAAQIDAGDAAQAQILATATHFNPVLLATSLRNRRGEPYHLADFVDGQAVFVSHKPIAGEIVRVIEHPGLWNGAMALWNTVFVELPIFTFAPVKTVLDLLRPDHRAGGD